jgi:ribosome modulation factor
LVNWYQRKNALILSLFKQFCLIKTALSRFYKLNSSFLNKPLGDDVKKHKRDQDHRSYVKGYQAAIQERSLATCPYQEQSIMAYHWSRGWREGREDYWNGFNQASFQQKAASL